MAKLYDSLGNLIFSDEPVSSWFGGFNIRHTAADAAGSFVIAITNPTASGRYLYLRNLRGRMAFDGTAVAAANLVYELVRYSSATTPNPTTGTTMTRTLKDTRLAGSILVDANAQYKSGVLTLGPSVIDSIHFFRLPASVTNGVTEIDFDPVVLDKKRELCVTGPNQGIGLRLTTAAIIGLSISGSFEFDERTA